VIFVVFSKKDEEVYHEVVPEYFPGPPSAESQAEASAEKPRE